MSEGAVVSLDELVKIINVSVIFNRILRKESKRNVLLDIFVKKILYL